MHCDRGMVIFWKCPAKAWNRWPMAQNPWCSALTLKYLNQDFQGPSPAAHTLLPVLGGFVVSFIFKLLEGEPLSILILYTLFWGACETKTRWVPFLARACIRLWKPQDLTSHRMNLGHSFWVQNRQEESRVPSLGPRAVWKARVGANFRSSVHTLTFMQWEGQ